MSNPDLAPEPRAVLERFLDDWRRRHECGDVEGLVELYLDEVLFFGSAPDLRTDHAGVRRYFSALPRHDGSQVVFSVLAATKPLPGVVEGASTALFSWPGNPGTGIRFTHTLVEREGRWLAACHHASPLEDATDGATR
jgi:hypothetical protein